MQVKLISITESYVNAENGKKLTPEELLVYIARVSNPSNQLNIGSSAKLLKYLIRNKHWSPFDQINLTVEVTTSKAIGIQILRHWSIKPQEFSQRYAEVTDIEPVELRKNGATNRQSSTEVFNPIMNGDPDWQHITADEMVKEHMLYCQSLYQNLLDADVAKECARMILPMATSTTMYLNGSIRSWIHYLQQRLDPHAQVEHQLVAQEIEKIFKQHFPNVWEAVQLLKRDEDPVNIIDRFEKWMIDTDWFHSGGYPGIYYNIDKEGVELTLSQLYQIHRDDKIWHQQNKL